jgi:Mce-associated membrane protein
LVAVTTDKDAETTSTAQELTGPSADVEVADAEVADADSGDSGDGSGPAETAEDQAEPPRRRRPRLLTAVLATLLAVALGGLIYLGFEQWQNHEVAQASQQAQAAAVAYAEVLTSIDSNKVDENFRQVLDGATGEFKDMYSASSVQLRQLLIDNKATAHGVVLESAVQSATKDKVVVLLFVDQSVTNTQLPDPRIDRSRIKMTMEHVDGSWRASKVELP